MRQVTCVCSLFLRGDSLAKSVCSEEARGAFEVAKKRMRRNVRKIEVIEQIQDFLAKRTSKKKGIMEKFKRYLEIVPEAGIPWTEEVLQRLERMPGFARPMAKKACL